MELGFSKDFTRIYVSFFFSPIFPAPFSLQSGIQREDEGTGWWIEKKKKKESFKGYPRAGGRNQLSPESSTLTAQRLGEVLTCQRKLFQEQGLWFQTWTDKAL